MQSGKLIQNENDPTYICRIKCRISSLRLFVYFKMNILMRMGNKNMKNVRRKLSFNLLQIDKCQQLDIMRNESVSRVRGEKSQITEIVQLVQHCTIPRQALSRLWAQGMRGNDNSFSEYSLVSFVDWAEVECLHYGRHSFTDCADIAHSLVRGDRRTAGNIYLCVGFH